MKTIAHRKQRTARIRVSTRNPGCFARYVARACPSTQWPGHLPAWLAAVALLAFSLAPLLPAAQPAWWTTRGVCTNVAITNNFAPVNVGQLKWFATNALNEFNATLPGGAGTNLQNSVYALCGATGSNYRIVNLGMLKNAVAPFFDRLAGCLTIGFTNSYPWSGLADDYKPANLGQLKQVFNIDTPPIVAILSPVTGDWKAVLP